MSATRSNRYFQYPQEFENAPPVRPGLYRFKLEGQLASGEWAFITDGEHEVRAPLTVEIVDSRFENWGSDLRPSGGRDGRSALRATDQA